MEAVNPHIQNANGDLQLDRLKSLARRQAAAQDTKSSEGNFADMLTRAAGKTNPASEQNVNRPAGRRFSRAATGDYLAGRGVTSSVVFENRNIKAEVENDPRKAELWKASEEMESLFLKIMLSSMRKNINKTKLIDGGRAEEIFEDMLYDEHAKNMANMENFGLAENLYEQMRDAL